MEDILKNIKKKLSIENLIGSKKEAKPDAIKDDDVKRTLEKVDPNNLVDAEELATKLTEIAEQAQADNIASKSNKTISSYNVLTKPSEKKEEEDAYIKDDVSFLD